MRNSPPISPAPSDFDPTTGNAPARTHNETCSEFLLYGLQSPINIGMILRVGETYGFRISIYDHHGVLARPEALLTIEDFSCGALLRRGFRVLSDSTALDVFLEGKRLVSTAIDPNACALPAYEFRPGDVFALGNEYDGLPESLIARADTVLNIPMPSGWTPKPVSLNPIDAARKDPVARDGRPSLNVAMTAGILCYTCFASRQAGNQPL
jgi:tRNA G18 (ribose-2'-O)-methylase SpoU